VEVRELRLDVFGGPARGSSQFIVTKRAGASQFEAAGRNLMRVKDGLESSDFSKESRRSGFASGERKREEDAEASSLDPLVRR
jgi:hypothetical protein